MEEDNRPKTLNELVRELSEANRELGSWENKIGRLGAMNEKVVMIWKVVKRDGCDNVIFDEYNDDNKDLRAETCQLIVRQMDRYRSLMYDLAMEIATMCGHKINKLPSEEEIKGAH